jgi:hypothetical protein
MGKKIGKSFRKIRRISREFRGKVFAGFSGFSGVGVIFGTAVMAKRIGRRDRSGAGFPSWWPTAARVGDGPGASGAGGIRNTRAERKRIDRGFKRG